jgi:hypothetical protein
VNEKFLVAMANGIKFFHELIVHKAEDWSFLQLVITLMNEAEGEMLELGEDVQAYTRTESQVREDYDDLESVAGTVALPKVAPASSRSGAGAGSGVCAGYTRSLKPSASAEALTAKVLEESHKNAEQAQHGLDDYM